MKGVLGFDYHLGRRTKRSLFYRLGKRTEEVMRAINEYCPDPKNILDLGAADGLMLSRIKDDNPKSECLGIEYAPELITASDDQRIKIIQADVLALPPQILKKKFDVIIAAALIEHLESPEILATAVYKMLTNKGIFIVTTPVPFFAKMASLMGHLPKHEHQQLFGLTELRELFAKNNFRVLKIKKFMFSPIGFPFERKIENLMRIMNLDFLLANQLIILGR